MKKIMTMVCVLATAGVLSACESVQNEVKLYEAQQAAERAEAKADAALQAAKAKDSKGQRAFDASQRK